MGFDLCVAGALRQPRCGMAACRVIVGGEVVARRSDGGSSSAARWLAERAATIGRRGRTDFRESIVSTPSPAASTS